MSPTVHLKFKKNDKCGGALAGGIDLELGNNCGALQSSGGNISASMTVAKVTVSSLKNEFSLPDIQKKTEEICCRCGLHIRCKCQLKDLDRQGLRDMVGTAKAWHSY